MPRPLSIALLLIAVTTGSRGETIAIRAARMLDVSSGNIVSDAVVVVEDKLITAAGHGIAIPASARVVDLGDVTLLPGLIDAHTHLMARVPDNPDGYRLNLLTKSQAFRALEGAANARQTLRAGFTSVRDVESEGSGYADVALRDAIKQGLVEGPRMQVATRGIAAVGQYHPFGISPDLKDFPTGAQMVSGADEARRAAREQIGNGADLIKVYADWGRPTLTVEEMRTVVDEAHRASIKVAAHADTAEGIRNALTAGVDSIEHAGFGDRSSFEMMKQKNAFWVTTRGAFFFGLGQATTPGARKYYEDMIQRARENIVFARQLGVKVANGFDASSAEDQGRNARELVAMKELGATPIETIRSSTVLAAELMGWSPKVGSLEAGKFADVIAVSGNPLDDITRLEHVSFVMKDGTVVISESGRR